MTFIGMITEYKSFENIKEILKKNFMKDIKLIHINKKSIGNIKNIKFETIVIDERLEKYTQEINIIRLMCRNAKYVVLNTDLNTLTEEIKKLNYNIITFGLNRKATVTISSINESGILIYLQRNLKNIKGNTIEIGEELVKINEENRIKTSEILIIYTIFLIQQKPIMIQSKEKSDFFEEI